MTERLFLTSRLLDASGIVHGFSLRGGGVSAGAFASLNLSAAVGDDAANVRDNLQRLRAAAGIEVGVPLATAHQVHGDRVVAVKGEGLVEVFPESDPASRVVSGESSSGETRADVLLGLSAGTAVGIRVADCVPLLLAAPGQGAVAAVHSGWRGARVSVAGRAVRALQRAAGADPERLLAAVGPCIGRCCYEVSADLAALFRRLFGDDVADDPARGEKPHLDLRLCVERALRAAGLPAGRIEQVPGCTSCDASSWFSHRRDRGRTGRHLAFVQA